MPRTRRLVVPAGHGVHPAVALPVWPGSHTQSVSSTMYAGELLFEGHIVRLSAAQYEPDGHGRHSLAST